MSRFLLSLFLLLSIFHVEAINLSGDSIQKKSPRKNELEKLEAAGFPTEFEGYDIYSPLAFSLFLVSTGIAIFFTDTNNTSLINSTLSAVYGMTMIAFYLFGLILSGQNINKNKHLKGKLFLYLNILNLLPFLFVSFFLFLISIGGFF
jgi:hypothetical protein